MRNKLIADKHSISFEKTDIELLYKIIEGFVVTSRADGGALEWCIYAAVLIDFEVALYNKLNSNFKSKKLKVTFSKAEYLSVLNVLMNWDSAQPFPQVSQHQLIDTMLNYGINENLVKLEGKQIKTTPYWNYAAQ